MECAGAIAAIQEDTMNPIIQKACDYIEKNISQDISLEQLSASLNVSPFYLSKLFKEEKGALISSGHLINDELENEILEAYNNVRRINNENR